MKVVLSILFLLSVSFADDITVDSLLKVYDGDTFMCNIRHCGCYDMFSKDVSIRIYGINAPEIRGGTEASRAKAQLAKQELSKILRKAKVITLQDVQRDKYFRIVAKVYADTLDVATYMISHKLATAYFGGTKEP